MLHPPFYVSAPAFSFLRLIYVYKNLHLHLDYLVVIVKKKKHMALEKTLFFYLLMRNTLWINTVELRIYPSQISAQKPNQIFSLSEK